MWHRQSEAIDEQIGHRHDWWLYVSVACDRYVTLVLPSGKLTRRHIQTVVVVVLELWHTYHLKSGSTSTNIYLSNSTYTALLFYSGSYSLSTKHLRMVMYFARLFTAIVLTCFYINIAWLSFLFSKFGNNCSEQTITQQITMSQIELKFGVMSISCTSSNLRENCALMNRSLLNKREKWRKHFQLLPSIQSNFKCWAISSCIALYMRV